MVSPFSKISGYIKRNPLGGKLLLYIVLFSSTFTFVVTALQLYHDYKKDVGLLQTQMSIIEDSYMLPLATNIWNVDKASVETVLTSILNLPDIQYVELQDRTAELSLRLGEKEKGGSKKVTHEFSIEYRMPGAEGVVLGDLLVVATLEHVYQRLRERLFIILGSQAVKTFCVSIFIFFITYYLITRHLATIAGYAGTFSFKTLDLPLGLKRKLPLKHRPDELDKVVNAINKMRAGLSQEILDRRLAEDSLLQSKNLFTAIFEQAAVGVARIDSKTGRFVEINQRYCDILGYTKEEMLGIDFMSITYPEDCQQDAELIEKLKRSSIREYSREKRYFHKDGHLVWVKISVSPMWDVDEEPDYHIAVVEDISIHKQIEVEREKLMLQLQQSQKMEAIGTLAGGIAHDFNNILTAIIGYTEFAREKSPPDSAVAEDLDKVLQASNRAKDLVKRILAFSRRANTESIPLQPAMSLLETTKLIRSSLPTTIEIHEEISTETGLIVVDPTQYHQIIMNLCTNAYHAMEVTGGRLDILLREIELQEKDLLHEPDVKPGKYIQLSICDTGSGIPPEIKDKIFDPYFTTKETGKGTGMGLSIIHGIVKSYGGFISLDSEVGKGTKFHVFLPVVHKEALPSIELVGQILPGSEWILLVDDEEMLAEMGRDMLERMGYKVIATSSSLEALEIFQESPELFDLVLTDQTMPGMTGSELSRAMLQIRPDLPIILCTGYSSIVSQDDIQAIGIREFASKPFLKRELSRLIRKVLDTE